MPRPQQHKLPPAALRVPNTVADEVDTLLRHETRDADDKGRVRILLQAQSALQEALAECLAARCGRVEGGRDEWVSAGTPEGGINAVEDAREL